MDKVAFILGAGAHVPFGFPTGKQLKSRVCEVLIADASHPQVFPDHGLLIEAEAALRGCGVSIDRWLSNNPKYNDVVRPRIAQVLLGFEKTAMDGAMDDWIEYIWQHIAKDEHKSIIDGFVFVTFNYDRLLEYRLAQACAGLWGKDPFDACDQVDKLEIYHVYGTLGSIVPGTESYCGFGDVTAADTAGKGIKIVGEREHQPELEVARRLAHCKYIFIMGCHYHPENMDIILKALPPIAKGRVFGTTLGFEAAEIEETLKRRYAPTIKFLSNNLNCLSLMRQYRIFQGLLP